MLDSKGFDLWAENYDVSVSVSHGYPFEGYYDVLESVLRELGDNITGKRILDVGFGTGTLTNRLLKDGAQVYGIDFSSSMVNIARKKMPEGIFEQYDFSVGFPESFSGAEFDNIISTYAIHHVPDEDKCRLFSDWMNILSESGRIIVGDICFESTQDLEYCKKQSIKKWDDDELYFVYQNIKPCLDIYGIASDFLRVSSCAGILVMSKAIDRKALPNS